MYVTKEEVKVYNPEEGKAIKLTKDGKVVMYMVTPYFELPNYKYDVEEVDIQEADDYYAKGIKSLKRKLKFFK